MTITKILFLHSSLKYVQEVLYLITMTFYKIIHPVSVDCLQLTENTEASLKRSNGKTGVKNYLFMTPSSKL